LNTAGTPPAAKSQTKARSKAAKKRGVPENLKKYVEAGRQAKIEEEKPVVVEPVGVEQPKKTRIRKKIVK